MQTGVDAMKSRRLLRTVLVDFLFAVVLIVPIIVLQRGVEPFRRGFFCNDESLRYPFRPGTISSTVLLLLSLAFPLLLIVVVEILAWFCGRAAGKKQPLLAHWSSPSWLSECCRQCFYYVIGYMLAINVQEVGKFTLGRLRPNFMAVCQPQLLDGSSCGDPGAANHYIEDYVCVGSGYSAAIVRQIRLSFPSGHTVMTTFAMVYLTLYLQSRMKWRGSHLAVHLFQAMLLMTAYYVGLTRISDYWHHCSDVVAGALIGGGVALLTAIYMTKMFASTASGSGEQPDLKLPQQQTSVDVLQVVATTLEQRH